MFVLLLISLCLITPNESLKILGYNPIFAHSHSTFIGRIADVLAEAGHEVVLISPVMLSVLPNRTSAHARVIHIDQTPRLKKLQTEILKEHDNLWAADSSNVFSLLKVYKKTTLDTMAANCKNTIETPGLLSELRDEHFDIAFSEDLDKCGFIIFKLLGIDKYALTRSHSTMDGNFRITGMPSFPSYVPAMLGTTGEKMSLWERIRNVASNMVICYIANMGVNSYDAMMKEANLGIDSITDLLSSSTFFFTNTEPLVDFPRPIVSKMVEIGGITAVKYKPLDEYWSSVLSMRNKTVLISFGSVFLASKMPEVYKRSIIDVVRSFPNVTFIWKYERREDNIGEGVENLITSPWTPQLDLLYDARLTAFVTHGGSGSVSESRGAGVPLVAVPVAADEFRNAFQEERQRTAIVVKKEELSTPNALRKALSKILDCDDFRVRAQFVANMIRDRPFSMRDRLVKHFEFMAAYGPLDELNHHSIRMGWIEYYLLDMIAIALCVTLSAVGFAMYVSVKIVRLLKISSVKEKAL